MYPLKAAWFCSLTFLKFRNLKWAAFLLEAVGRILSWLFSASRGCQSSRLMALLSDFCFHSRSSSHSDLPSPPLRILAVVLRSYPDNLRYLPISRSLSSYLQNPFAMQGDIPTGFWDWDVGILEGLLFSRSHWDCVLDQQPRQIPTSRGKAKMWEVDGMQGLSVPVQNSMISFIFYVKNEMYSSIMSRKREFLP